MQLKCNVHKKQVAKQYIYKNKHLFLRLEYDAFKYWQCLSLGYDIIEVLNFFVFILYDLNLLMQSRKNI